MQPCSKEFKITILQRTTCKNTLTLFILIPLSLSKGTISSHFINPFLMRVSLGITINNQWQEPRFLLIQQDVYRFPQSLWYIS